MVPTPSFPASRPCATCFARPKSRILACPRSVTKRFAGLISRWTMPLAWGGFESVGNLDTDVEEALKFEWAAKEQLFECLPFQVLHNNEGPSVIFANFVDGADIWMVQRRCSAGFTTASGRNFKATKRPS